MSFCGGPTRQCTLRRIQGRKNTLIIARNVIANRRTQQGTVVLEFTESAIMTTTQNKVGWLRELKEMGGGNSR
jgi:EAL domain-containing protein (putative c-di-GMP-specific phosphodiesterase class I)